MSSTGLSNHFSLEKILTRMLNYDTVSSKKLVQRTLASDNEMMDMQTRVSKN